MASLITLMFGAFLAGIALFLLPCTYPLIPGYLAILYQEGDTKQKMMKKAVAFLVGFSIIILLLFGVLSVAGFTIQVLFAPFQSLLIKLGGIIIIFFGILIIFAGAYPSFLKKTYHFVGINKPTNNNSITTSFSLGAFLALGWTPCLGPIIGSIVILTSLWDTFLEGLLLLTVFLIGFTLPFLAIAWVYASASTTPKIPNWFFKAVSIIGGLVLIILGFLLFFDELGLIAYVGYQTADNLGWLSEVINGLENIAEKFFNQ
ncbi:MAG: hypothetical protein OXU73_02605 [Candidatus Campbellbacteria bacterium]|nr:hypothetical protein [Candidatus Campbellbacteria bacterium]